MASPRLDLALHFGGPNHAQSQSEGVTSAQIALQHKFGTVGVSGPDRRSRNASHLVDKLSDEFLKAAQLGEFTLHRERAPRLLVLRVLMQPAEFALMLGAVLRQALKPLARITEKIGPARNLVPPGCRSDLLSGSEDGCSRKPGRDGFVPRNPCRLSGRTLRDLQEQYQRSPDDRLAICDRQAAIPRDIGGVELFGCNPLVGVTMGCRGWQRGAEVAPCLRDG